MELKDKKILILGDSITEGVGASELNKSFTYLLEKMSGAKVIPYGLGGSRIARQTNKTLSDPLSDIDFNMRVDDMDNNADIVLVFGGTNDFGRGDAPMGNNNDMTEYSFYGALHVLYQKLINKYSESVICIITPLHRLNENITFNCNGLKRKTLKEYVHAIKEIAEYYSLPVIDLFATSGIQPEVEIIQKIYLPDGLHPSNKGHKKIAEIIYNFLRNY